MHVLGAVGLDEAEETTYRALVGLGAADVGDLARRLGRRESDTLRALRRLERHGLAAHSSGRPDRYVAAPPAVALGALLTRHRHDLEQAELAVASLAQEYRSGAAGKEAHDLIEVVTGAEAVRRRFGQLQLGAAEEVCALVTDAPVVVKALENEYEPLAVARGVRFRVVIERGVLTMPGGVAELRAALGRGERVRVVDRVPTRLVIADRTLAMVPLARGADEPNALVVHASGVMDSLLSLFEAVWSQAQPIHLAETGGAAALVEECSGGPDAMDLQILSLLLAGFTDTSVAKQLDVGLRTVQRRVKRLMELARVTTRLQLGWHAYEKEWIARHDPRGTAPAPPPGPRPAVPRERRAAQPGNGEWPVPGRGQGREQQGRGQWQEEEPVAGQVPGQGQVPGLGQGLGLGQGRRRGQEPGQGAGLRTGQPSVSGGRGRGGPGQDAPAG